MKRIHVAVLLALLGAIVFAQAPGPSAQGAPTKDLRPRDPEAISGIVINGSLVFVDDRPAVKTTDGKTVFLEMPRFYYYAYTEGFKAGISVKARGALITAPDESPEAGKSVLMAEEVTIGGKTYIIVSGPQAMGKGPAPQAPGGQPNPGPASSVSPDKKR